MKQDVSSNEIVDELEEAKRLLNEADSKLDEAAKIFCSGIIPAHAGLPGCWSRRQRG